MSITLMASAISTSTSLCSPSSFPSTKSTTCYLSTFSVSFPKSSSTFALTTLVPPLGLCPYSSWNGLRHLGVSISHKSLKIERKERCKGKGIYASLFGIGAPEALVIGVVALLVFGPKGLAEVARNLGQTLRAFQPTIRELQDVSRELKSTLEREIGLDDISISSQNSYSSNATKTTSTPSSIAKTEDSGAVVDFNGGPSQNRADSSEDDMKITEEQLKASASEHQEQSPPPLSESVDGGPSPSRAYSSEEYLKITEEQLKASASQQQGETPPQSEPLEGEAQTQSQGSVQEVAAAIPPSRKLESET